jgi:branched-chain amino acid aminotransferase
MSECLGKLFIRNGQLIDKALFDSTFVNGPDYIYEVFRVTKGVALFLEDHLDRLKVTCNLAGASQQRGSSILTEWIYRLIETNDLDKGNIKMMFNHKTCDLFIYITEHLYPTEEEYRSGVAISLLRAMRSNPNAKIMEVELRNAANRMKQQKQVYETLLVDKDGCITEGSRSNVFFVRNGEVLTAPLEDVLPGVTRKHVLDVCRNLTIPVREEKIPARSLVVMEGGFISGTSRKVLPINRVDELDFDARHPLILQIMDGFNQKVDEYISARRKS